MSCRRIVVQTYLLTLTAGEPLLVAKCAGGRMEVEEIALQLLSAAAADIQFFEGLPAQAQRSLGSPLGLQVSMAQYQLITIPGKTVSDDIYVLTDVNASVSVSVRVISGGVGTAQTLLS